MNLNEQEVFHASYPVKSVPIDWDKLVEGSGEFRFQYYLMDAIYKALDTQIGSVYIEAWAMSSYDTKSFNRSPRRDYKKIIDLWSTRVKQMGLAAIMDNTPLSMWTDAGLDDFVVGVCIRSTLMDRTYELGAQLTLMKWLRLMKDRTTDTGAAKCWVNSKTNLGPTCRISLDPLHYQRPNKKCALASQVIFLPGHNGSKRHREDMFFLYDGPADIIKDTALVFTGKDDKYDTAALDTASIVTGR